MFGMAMLLRRCGAMYMRRSFKDDKVYGTIFKKYVQTVIANGNSPFEFFIEGTRSRCGKSLIPKLGNKPFHKILTFLKQQWVIPSV